MAGFVTGAVAGVMWEPEADIISCREALALGERQTKMMSQAADVRSQAEADRMMAEGVKVWDQYTAAKKAC